MKKVSFKTVLPEYPSMPHLPWKPNAKSDKIASEREASVLFDPAYEGADEALPFSIQEKVDGASCGMAFLNDHPVVRSRSKILRKGQELKNPSQAQFASAWNWMHQNKAKFAKLRPEWSVYGEWMIQQHGMVYDNLPDWFIAYDIYDYETGFFLDPHVALHVLAEAGFATSPELRWGRVMGWVQLEDFANTPSAFAVGKLCEGIVVKGGDGIRTTHRFKMVRQGFEQGSLLTDKMNRNSLRGF